MHRARPGHRAPATRAIILTRVPPGPAARLSRVLHRGSWAGSACLWPRPPAPLGHVAGQGDGAGTLPQVPIFPQPLSRARWPLCLCPAHVPHFQRLPQRLLRLRFLEWGTPPIPSPSGPSCGPCPRSRHCTWMRHASPTPRCPWAPLGTARLTPALGWPARQAPWSQLWSPRALPSPAATPGLCLCRDPRGATPPLCPALASQAAEKRLGLRRPEGQLKDMTGGGRAGQSSGPSCHLCGCAQGWDSDHWASVGMWPSQYQAVWAVGQGAPWEGRWEGWHVGLESPRPGQPWLCRVSSWPSGQVTKSLGMSAFGTCDTRLRCGSNSAPQSVAKSMDLSVSTHLEVNRHVPSSQQVSKRPLVPSTCGNSLASRADASGRR